MQLNCGIANRLFTIDSNIYYKDLYWINIKNTKFHDLFDLDFQAIARAPSLMHRIYNIEANEKQVIKPRIRRNASSNSCCLCSDLRCGPTFHFIKPHPVLREALDKFKKRIGKNAISFHWRNDEEKDILGRQSFLYSQKKFVKMLSTKNISYVAVQKKEDADFIRKNYPNILLQQDFRSLTYNRNSYNGLISAVFDLFALAMSKQIKCSSKQSTFCRVSKCLKY